MDGHGISADEEQNLFTLLGELEGNDNTDDLWYNVSKAVGRTDRRGLPRQSGKDERQEDGALVMS